MQKFFASFFQKRRIFLFLPVLRWPPEIRIAGFQEHHPALDFDSTECYIARVARIDDIELGEAFREIMNGQADDLGDGVFKKRLNKNMHRSIILAKGGRYWIYQYLFAKKDRTNIRDDELEDFRTLARGYATLGADQIARLLEDNDLMEICHEGEKQVQR